jgi:hypothetical protein
LVTTSAIIPVPALFSVPYHFPNLAELFYPEIKVVNYFET